MKLLAVDTETTGLDVYHGCLPYFFSICDQDQTNTFWEWDVDPYTRIPYGCKKDLLELKEELESADRLVFMNSKFDMKMIDAAGAIYGVEFNWDWNKIHDISISCHMLGSAQLKNLTTQAIRFISWNLEPYEKAVELATQKARRTCRLKRFKSEVGEWNISRDDHPQQPSGGGWKSDMWVLRALVKHAPQFLPDWEYFDGGLWTSEKIIKKRGQKPLVVKGDNPEDHPWQELCEVYANPDTAATVAIHQEHMDLIADRDLEKIYERRRKLLKIVYDIESLGVTVSRKRKEEISIKFEEEAEKALNRCINLSKGKLDSLPLQGVSNALREVVFDDFGLESPKNTATGNPSMDKEVLDYWLLSSRPNSREHIFIDSLKNYRKRMTALNYMRGYERFWVPTLDDDIYILHPSLNMTGTTTLRWSSSNPNEQNISKQEGFNLRYIFGPPPGYMWASFDYENLELRIPAYESGEADLIDLFERANEPPYYGSNHLLNFSVIYPDIWDPVLREVGVEEVAEQIKKRYKSTWYQRCKNGNFAVQYGAIEREDSISTADKAYGREGCHRMLKQKFSKLTALNEKYIAQAEEFGYVTTIPDKVIDPDHGYPLECSRTKYGSVRPTVPLNYHVQGTACQVIGEAMIEVEGYLSTVRPKLRGKSLGVVMQVHDELDVLIPIAPIATTIIRDIKRIMTSMGDRIGVPLKVGCDIHKNNWAEGVPFED